MARHSHEIAPQSPDSGGVVSQPITVSVELTDDLALALAQFVKRATFSEFRACAVDDDEAYQISDAVAKLQRALAEAGYAPR